MFNNKHPNKGDNSQSNIMYERENSMETYSSEIVRKKATVSDMEINYRDLAFIVSGGKDQEEINFPIEVCVGEYGKLW